VISRTDEKVRRQTAAAEAAEPLCVELCESPPPLRARAEKRPRHGGERRKLGAAQPPRAPPPPRAPHCRTAAATAIIIELGRARVGGGERVRVEHGHREPQRLA
jgi:hypothetical protein